MTASYAPSGKVSNPKQAHPMNTGILIPAMMFIPPQKIDTKGERSAGQPNSSIAIRLCIRSARIRIPSYTSYNRQGNYLGIHNPDFEFTPEYGEYDNHTNPARYLNINFARVLTIPEADWGPLCSANNWLLHSQEFIESPPNYSRTQRKGHQNRDHVFRPGSCRNFSVLLYQTGLMIILAGI